MTGGRLFRDIIKRKKKWLWFRNWAPDVRKCGGLLTPPLSTEDPDQPSSNRVSPTQATTWTSIVSTRVPWWCQRAAANDDYPCSLPANCSRDTHSSGYGISSTMLYAYGQHSVHIEGVTLCQSALLPLCVCRGNCIFCSEARHTA